MIELAKGKGTLDAVVIEDRDVVNYFTWLKADEETDIESMYQDDLVRALKIGVQAIQRAQTHIDIDAVRHEFDELHHQMDRTLDAVFNKDRGDLVTSLVKYLGEDGKMVQLLEDMITSDGSQLSACRIIQQNSPLKKLHEALEKKFKDIEDKIIDVQKEISREQGRDEEAEHGTSQGVEFESFWKEY